MASKAVLLVTARELLDSVENFGVSDKFVDEAIEKLPEKFREGFRNLVDDMDTDLETLAFWETDEQAQRVFREIIQQRVDVMERVLKVFKELVA